jgi:hypothetical protein
LAVGDVLDEVADRRNLAALDVELDHRPQIGASLELVHEDGEVGQLPEHEPQNSFVNIVNSVTAQRAREVLGCARHVDSNAPWSPGK